MVRSDSGTDDSLVDAQPGSAAGARRTLVERLEADGVLTDPRLREALSRLDRGVLLPRAYVRRSEPGTDPVVWELLDGTHPNDRAEWQELESIHNLWTRAGSPDRFYVDIPADGGQQHVTSGTGPDALQWVLPPLAAMPGQPA
ncbi:hypothetical protein ACFXPY_41570 [Streptomyces sp. NPDC059153]|uniref:hypothetical protein n=1 Tax=unclassified Streptomyces TaxID=2593676 RepID=UPI0036A71993